MTTHLFPNFLADDSEYAESERFWSRLWGEVSEETRIRAGWRSRWFEPQPPKDGNPIFTAVSETQRKGIRVIQYEPTSQEPEFDYWLDTFGGDAAESQAIRELVIACALSAETAAMARKIIASWVSGQEVADVDAAGFPAGSHADRSE